MKIENVQVIRIDDDLTIKVDDNGIMLHKYEMSWYSFGGQSSSNIVLSPEKWQKVINVLKMIEATRAGLQVKTKEEKKKTDFTEIEQEMQKRIYKAYPNWKNLDGTVGEGEGQ